MSVVFCDLVGSTDLAERLDPEPLRHLLDRYFEVLREVLERHGGTVEKFIGDAVMAVFGIPVLHEDDALRAVRAAGEIVPAVDALNPELQGRWGVQLRVRVGVHTGEVIAGDAGGGQRLATGHAVNLAARLQALAGASQVVVGEATYRLVHDAVRAEQLGAVAVKGKAEPVRPYRLLEVRPREDGSARRPTSALVGRGRELAALHAALRGVGRGSPARRVVVGMAGVGKSRLLAEFLSAAAEGATVLTGRCLSYGQGITFWPVREMLQSAAGWREEDIREQAVAKLADLLPGEPDAELIADRVGQLLGLSEVTASLPENFWALRRLLEELCRWRPLVVVVDDLHWAEPTLLELTDYLVSATTQAPLLVLGAARPELFDARPDWAGGSEERIVVEPLGSGESTVLLDNLLGGARLPPAARDHVLTAAEGNPLFVEQMLAMLVDDGVLAPRNGTWTLTRAIVPELLPASITALLAARLERLPSAQQRAIEAGAVVGRVFWRGAVAELAREAVGPDAGAHLLDLVRRHLIRPEASSFPDEEAYKFRHVLIRDAAYAAMPKAARVEAHQRFADWLEHAAGERAGEYDEILGYHLERAYLLRTDIGVPGEDERRVASRAGQRLAAAGLRADARGDVSATISLLSRAEGLLAGDPSARIDVITALGRVLTLAGDLERARSTLTEAVRQTAESGDRRREARARVAFANQWRSGGYGDRVDKVAGVIQDAIRTLSAHADDAGLAEAWQMSAILHADAGHVRAAERELETALVHARRSGDRRLMREPHMWLASVSPFGPTPVDVIAKRFEWLAAEADGDLLVEAALLYEGALLAAMLAEFQRAHELLDSAVRMVRELGLATIANSLSQTGYLIALREGDITAAESALRADDSMLEQLGEHGVRSTILAMLAHVQVARGHLDDAEHYIGAARELTDSDDLFSNVLWRCAHAKVFAGRGQHKAAEERAREAVSLAADSDWLCLHGDALLDLADILHCAGEDPGARKAADAAHRLYQRKGDLASADRAAAFIRKVADPVIPPSP